MFDDYSDPPSAFTRSSLGSWRAASFGSDAFSPSNRESNVSFHLCCL